MPATGIRKPLGMHGVRSRGLAVYKGATATVPVQNSWKARTPTKGLRMSWLEIILLIATYIFGGMYTYRRRYIRLYKNWKRWQAEDPRGDYAWAGEYDMIHRERRKVDFHRYCWTVQDHTPAGVLAVLWPFYFPAKAVKNFVRPEIKAPDYEKIRELETIDDD